MLHLPVLADDVSTIVLQDTTRIEARSTQPFPLTPDSNAQVVLAGDVYTSPGAFLEVKSPFWDFNLGYTGTFMYND
ncbi:MAG: hypothetical protein FWD17_18555, partial [Polyangiaceae bacterium]|nr:hypothetical protein [Polyangiaceae bacterium]